MRLIVGLINLLVAVTIVVLLGVAYIETTQFNEQIKEVAFTESEIIHSSLSGAVSDTNIRWSPEDFDLGVTYGYVKELYFQGETDDSWLKINLDTWEITISKELDMDAASLMFIRGVQYYAEDRIEYLERILDQKGIPYE